MRTTTPLSLFSLPIWLVACALPAPPATVTIAPPAQWQAPLPHHGQLDDLARWWQRFADPVLLNLIDAAQQVNPTLAAAHSRIEQARAGEALAAAALRPLADASASTSRGRQTTIIGAPLAMLSQARVQASWETDLFGGLAATRSAAQARLQGAEAQWHDARVSVAAEVAGLYFNWRSCQDLLAVAREDAQSRTTTARLTELSANAGFAAPSSAALARASAAEGSAKRVQQQAQCDTDVKGLVALTAVDEPDLRQKLLSAQSAPAHAATFSIANIPAEALRQRPDLFNAEREVAAASAEVGSAQAERYPRLSLTGSVGALNLRAGGVSTNISAWSIGPLSVTLPVLDGGKFAANLSAAQARYDEAAATYRAKARQAVREVEEALVALDSANARRQDVQTATASYRTMFQATEARQRAGLAPLSELEDARRTALAAQSALISYQRETLGAWIALYRAVGGGWTPSGETARTATASAP